MRLAPAVLALLACLAPPAAAEEPDFLGGCGWSVPTRPAPVHNMYAPSTRTVVLDLQIVLPEPGDVTCQFRVDGVTQAVLGPVPVLVAGAAAVAGTYTAADYAHTLSICTVVDYAGSRADVTICEDEPVIQTPPFEGWELLDDVLDHTEWACPLVGDVYVAYEWVYDCDGPAT